jgi:hypothetical protein
MSEPPWPPPSGPPPPAGPPPGYPPPGYPPSGTPPPVPGSKIRWPLIAGGLAALLVIALVVGFLVFKDDGKEGEVLLEPVASQGVFPWTASVVPPDAPTSVPLPPPTAPPPPPASGQAGQAKLVGVTGDRTGSTEEPSSSPFAINRS